MEIRLEEVTVGNWRELIALKLAKGQEKYVADNLSIFGRAHRYREEGAKLYGIYRGSKPIGLILTRDYQEDLINYCILDQIMLDEKYQGQGYGKTSLKLLIELVSLESSYEYMSLCFIEGDLPVQEFYGKLGFKRVYEKDNGDELVMELKL